MVSWSTAIIVKIGLVIVLIIHSNYCMSLQDPDDPFKLSDDTRPLGLVVCRGTSVVLVCPMDGMEAIANPFL